MTGSADAGHARGERGVRPEVGSDETRREAVERSGLGEGRRLAAAFRSPRRDIGEEPDYRFTFANERTFLAWMRTALALDAGGLVLIEFLGDVSVPYGAQILGTSLVVLGTAIAVVGYGRWARSEEALRLLAPLPASRLPKLLAIGTTLISVLAVVVVLSARGG